MRKKGRERSDVLLLRLMSDLLVSWHCLDYQQRASAHSPQPAAALGSSCGWVLSSARTDSFKVILSLFWPGQSSFSQSCSEGSKACIQVYYLVPRTSSLGAVALGGRKMDSTQNHSHFVPFSKGAKWGTELVGWWGWGKEWLVQCRPCG